MLIIAGGDSIPSQNISISNGIAIGEVTASVDKRPWAFVCYDDIQSATFYLKDPFSFGQSKQNERSHEKYYSPLNCKIDEPVHFSRQNIAYIKTTLSCENYQLYKKPDSTFRLAGIVIKDDKFEYIASSSFFNTTSDWKEGMVSAKFAKDKETLKTESFLLQFYLEIGEEDRSGPIYRREFSYYYPKSFTGETPNLPKGVFAMYGDSMYDDAINAERGSTREMYCMTLGNPLPQLTFLKGETEVKGTKEEVWFKYIRSKVCRLGNFL